MWTEKEVRPHWSWSGPERELSPASNEKNKELCPFSIGPLKTTEFGSFKEQYTVYENTMCPCDEAATGPGVWPCRRPPAGTGSGHGKSRPRGMNCFELRQRALWAGVQTSLRSPPCAARWSDKSENKITEIKRRRTYPSSRYNCCKPALGYIHTVNLKLQSENLCQDCDTSESYSRETFPHILQKLPHTVSCAKAFLWRVLEVGPFQGKCNAEFGRMSKTQRKSRHVQPIVVESTRNDEHQLPGWETQLWKDIREADNRKFSVHAKKWKKWTRSSRPNQTKDGNITADQNLVFFVWFFCLATKGNVPQ